MNVNYHNWLTLQTTNTYFSKAICNVLELSPFSETQKELKNYQILINKETNTFSFYIGLKNKISNNTVIQELQGLNNLYFQISNSDPLFESYTDISSLGKNQILYFENNSEGSLLNTDFVTDENILDYRGKKFSVELPSGNIFIEIKTTEGEIVNQFTIKDTENIKTYAIDLTNFKDGVYQMWLNKKLTDSFFCTSEQLAINCIGILNLNINNLLQHYQEGLKYNLAFNAKSVFWQYQIIVAPTRKIDITKMSLIAMDSEEYKGPDKQEIFNGQLAQVFTSKQPILLQNELKINPQLQITYSNNFSNREKQLEIKLPNPKVEGIKTNYNGKNKSFLSSTVIYV